MGLLLPVSLSRAKAACDGLCEFVAAAAAVGPEAVQVEKILCKRWAFSRHTGVEGLRKCLGELSLETLRKLVADDKGECGQLILPKPRTTRRSARR